jgi:hypothetical protein
VTRGVVIALLAVGASLQIAGILAAVADIRAARGLADDLGEISSEGHSPVQTGKLVRSAVDHGDRHLLRVVALVLLVAGIAANLAGGIASLYAPVSAR